MSRDVIMSILMLLLSFLKIYESQQKMILYLATFGFDISRGTYYYIKNNKLNIVTVLLVQDRAVLWTS